MMSLDSKTPLVNHKKIHVESLRPHFTAFFDGLDSLEFLLALSIQPVRK